MQIWIADEGAPMSRQLRDLILIDLVLGFLYLLADYGVFAQADSFGREGYGFAWSPILIHPKAYQNTPTFSGVIPSIINFPFLLFCLTVVANIGFVYRIQRSKDTRSA
jgi:hypothetical protein